MIEYKPFRLAITTEVMLSDHWYEELGHALEKLERAQSSVALQIAPYAHVVYDQQREMVYVYPKHFRHAPYMVDAIPTAVKGAFLRQYMASNHSSKLDEWLAKEFPGSVADD